MTCTPKLFIKRTRKMKMFKHILLLILFIQTVPAQIENIYEKNRNNSLPKYYQDFLNFASDQEGKTRLDIFIQVPYTEIQFVKGPKGFNAAYTVTVSVFDEDKEKLLVEKSWKEKIAAIDFEQTDSKNNYNLSLKSFYLAPGMYFITTSVEDEDSRKKYSSENIYKVRDLSEEISVSDIMLIAKHTPVEGSNKILPNVSRNITSERDGIPMFFEIYSGEPSFVKLEFKIKDNKENVVHQEIIDKNLDTDTLEKLITKLSIQGPLQFKTEYELDTNYLLEDNGYEYSGVDIGNAIEEFINMIEIETVNKNDVIKYTLDLYRRAI